MTSTPDGGSNPHPCDEAEALVAAGRFDDAMEVLQEVSPDSGEYDRAVALATRVMWDEELPVTVEFNRFVHPFMIARTGGTEEAASLYGLARLYERLDVRSLAGDAYRAAMRFVPGFLDADERLAALEAAESKARRLAEMQASGEISARISSAADDTHESDVTDLAGHTDEVALERGVALGLGPVRAGTLVAQRYVLDRPVGEGGYAVVWAAWDDEAGRPVALKLFRRDTRDPKGYARFRGEMRITTRFRHPNIVRTYEVGAWRSACYIVMELLAGHDLYQWLRAAGGRRDITEVQPVIIQALRGLGSAHKAGVIHRDIKPRNIFVTERGVKVMDFGLATAVDVTGAYTRTGRVVGTPAYLAPERLRPAIGEICAATDIYAVGVVFFEAITGQLPFYEERLPKLFRRVLDEPPPYASHLNPAVPPSVDEVIRKMLAKTPHERYQNCAEVIEALEAL